MNRVRLTLSLIVSALTAGCAHPWVNEQRYIQVSTIISTIECELVAAAKHFPNEVNNVPDDDRWDIGTTLDLTLVSRVEADGKVAWVIPLYSAATPSLGGYVQDTATAHLTYATNLREAQNRVSSACRLDDVDPSGTGMGLAAWIRTSFMAAKSELGGISYTKILEFHADVGARFGYIFSPITADAGGAYRGTKTDQIVVAITPRGGPSKVIIVGDQRAGVTTLRRKSLRGSEPSATTILSNPALQNLLIRQAPVRLLPGQTLR